MGGSHRLRVETGAPLPAMDWAAEFTVFADTFPYLGPTWLAANEEAMPEAKPWHTVGLRSHGEHAVLPGYILSAPPSVDFDPRTYLGWSRPDGQEVCCGVQLEDDATDEVAAMGEDSFFPCLLLGSPLGYRTEVAYNFWSPQLFGTMVDKLLTAAQTSGVRSVIAPWVPSRPGNEDLVAALERHGAASGFWGYENFMRLRTGGWDEHLAALPSRRRRRLSADTRRLEATGLLVERLDGEALRPHIARIAELTCLNREKNGAGQDPRHIEVMLTRLLDHGADVRGYLGFRDGQVLASIVVLRKGQRLYAKWGGFDYATIGDRSGVYFAMGLDAPVRDAYAEGLRAVEFGAGAHEAKSLRGCESRAITTVMWLADEQLRPRAGQLLRRWSNARRAAFVAEPTLEGRELPLVSAAGDACCSTG